MIALTTLALAGGVACHGTTTGGSSGLSGDALPGDRTPGDLDLSDGQPDGDALGDAPGDIGGSDGAGDVGSAGDPDLGDSPGSRYSSPAMITGEFNTQGYVTPSTPLFSTAQLDFIAAPGRYTRLIGLDGHGYNFASAPIEAVRARGYRDPIFCLTTASLVEGYNGPRYAALADHEEVFYHTADPASASLFRWDAGASGMQLVFDFRQDFRAYPHYRPAELACAVEPCPPADDASAIVAKPIDAYVIRSAADPAGPYDTVVATVPLVAADDPYHFYQAAVSANAASEDAWYRINSRYAGGVEVSYSEPFRLGGFGGNLGQVGDFTKPLVVSARLRPDPVTPIGDGVVNLIFEAACPSGYACPAATELGVVIDLNRDGTFASTTCTAIVGGQPQPAGCETLVFQTRADVTNAVLYTRPISLPLTLDLQQTRFAYRFSHLPTGANLGPFQSVAIEGVWQTVPAAYGLSLKPHPGAGDVPVIGQNNRLFHYHWYGALVRRSAPPWVDAMAARLGDCLARGYDGMHLDFAFQSPGVIAAAPPGFSLATYADEGIALLAALRAAHPTALVGFNGVYLADDYAYTLRQIAHSEQLQFEFFHNAATESGPPPVERLTRALDLSLAHGQHVVLSCGNDGVANLQARLASFAAYLLISNPRLSYFYVPDNAYQQVVYLPEWAVPLGAPLVASVAGAAELQVSGQPTGVLRREFANGAIYVSYAATTAQLDLGAPHYRVTATGGMVPALRPVGDASPGFDGALDYTAVTALTLPPGGFAIVVRER